MSHKRLILIISLLLPVAVSALYFMPKFSLDTVDFLPMVNACINGGVFLILISALIAIKKGESELAKNEAISHLRLIGNDLEDFIASVSSSTKSDYL